MKNILKEISEIAVRLDESKFTSEQKNSGWLGDDPASTNEIKSAEIKLGIKLPEDYKNFLLTTNGFFTPPDVTEPTFDPINKIDYLKNVKSFLLETWCENSIDEGKELARSIIIAGIDDEQFFLLIPPDLGNDKWKYWKFANWIPGIQSYENLESYFTAVLDFMQRIFGTENDKD